MPHWQTAMPVTQGPGGRIIGRGTWHTEEDEALKAMHANTVEVSNTS